ncbi:CAP domain-containing protein [Candidatus Poriferisocius sp.]|uniref:CAP domain-containing protein n=1 Tax=Candidatus Poriferisocius sp. TaxID=3101276 RepID=UPI003B0270F7
MELVPGGCGAPASGDDPGPGDGAGSDPAPGPGERSLDGLDITGWVEEVIARGGLGPEGDQVDEEIVAAEVAMSVLVNLLRVGQGLGDLTYDLRLVRVAREWSQEMAATGDFRHNPSFSDQYPPGWWTAAENIASYYLQGGENRWESLSATVVDAFEGLSDSPGHYANMANPNITHIGVGIALDGRQVYITQNFATYP